MNRLSFTFLFLLPCCSTMPVAEQREHAADFKKIVSRGLVQKAPVVNVTVPKPQIIHTEPLDKDAFRKDVLAEAASQGSNAIDVLAATLRTELSAASDHTGTRLNRLALSLDRTNEKVASVSGRYDTIAKDIAAVKATHAEAHQAFEDFQDSLDEIINTLGEQALKQDQAGEKAVDAAKKAASHAIEDQLWFRQWVFENIWYILGLAAVGLGYLARARVKKLFGIKEKSNGPKPDAG